MTKIKLLNIAGETVSEINFNSDLLVEKPHKQAMFDSVINENASQRQGTHSTLTKGEVRGGGKKPWKQKHTGRARTGSSRNPHWKGGGVVFGPKPTRNYLKKVNSKINKLAFKSALTIKLNNNLIYALEDKVVLEKPSTKQMLNFLNTSKLIGKKVLIISNEKDNIVLSTNNLPKITTKVWNTVSVRDLMNASILVIQENSINKMQEVYK